jgi:hypothetical protein
MQCQALKKNGLRCTVTACLTLCKGGVFGAGRIVCPAHWKNPPKAFCRGLLVNKR